MNAAELIHQAQTAGILISTRGNNLVVSSKQPPPPPLMKALRQAKPLLLDYCHRQETARHYFDLVAERLGCTTDYLLSKHIIEPCDLDDVAEGRTQGSPEQMAALLKSSFLWANP